MPEKKSSGCLKIDMSCLSDKAFSMVSLMVVIFFLSYLKVVEEGSSGCMFVMKRESDDERILENFSGSMNARSCLRKSQRSSLLSLMFGLIWSAFTFYSSCFCDANSCSSVWTLCLKNAIESAWVYACCSNSDSLFARSLSCYLNSIIVSSFY